MPSVHHKAVINAPRAKVFAYVNDHKNVPDYFPGISKFKPKTEQTEGVGAEFDSGLKIGPKELTSVNKCTKWEQDEVIRLETISGLPSATEFRFADGDEPNTTNLEFDMDYSLPGGLVGKIVAPLMGPFIEQGVRHTEKVVREKTEG